MADSLLMSDRVPEGVRFNNAEKEFFRDLAKKAVENPFPDGHREALRREAGVQSTEGSSSDKAKRSIDNIQSSEEIDTGEYLSVFFLAKIWFRTKHSFDNYICCSFHASNPSARPQVSLLPPSISPHRFLVAPDPPTLFFRLHQPIDTV